MPLRSSNKSPSPMLIVLCVLTILGNIFIILKGLFSYYFLYNSHDTRGKWAVIAIDLFYLVEFLTCVGSIWGAGLMLFGKRSGLVLYQISAMVYIAITIVLTFFSFISIAGIPLGFLQIVYLIPSFIFLVLYRNQAKQLV